jgi:hypothetical protein
VKLTAAAVVDAGVGRILTLPALVLLLQAGFTS